jgi:uncharacterized protein DUF3604
VLELLAKGSIRQRAGTWERSRSVSRESVRSLPTCGKQHWRIATASVVAGIVGFATSPAAAQGNPQRDAYFGQTHVHTSWSFDVYVFGNTKTGPKRPIDTRSASRSSIRPVTW